MTKQLKKNFKFDSNQKDIIIGTLLGDATIATRQGRPILRLKFEQQEKFKLYITHLYGEFKPLIGSPPAPRFNHERTKVVRFWVATYTNPSFKYYYDLFYKKHGSKRVPKQIGKLLNARVLAYWFMDDGTCKKLKQGCYAYGLSTQGFPYEDQLLLVKALKQCFGLQVTINKSGKYYKLYISTRSSSDFRLFVEPHLLSVFRYKLGI
jgi:hypothetical protein